MSIDFKQVNVSCGKVHFFLLTLKNGFISDQCSHHLILVRVYWYCLEMDHWSFGANICIIPCSKQMNVRTWGVKGLDSYTLYLKRMRTPYLHNWRRPGGIISNFAHVDIVTSPLGRLEWVSKLSVTFSFVSVGKNGGTILLVNKLRWGGDML